MTFVLMAGLNAALGLAVALLVRNRPEDQPPPSRQKSMFSGVRALVILPSYWAISLATFFRYGIIMALQGLWVGPWLTYGLGLSQIQAGNAILYLAFSQVIGLPIFGMISDRVARSRKKIILPSMMMMTLLIGCMVLFQRGVNTWVVYGFCLLLGLTSCPGQILYAHIKELMPPESAGAAMTGINLFTMLGPATLIQVAGMLVADEPSHLTGPEGFNPVWWMMFGGLALACLAYAFVPDSKALKSQ
jgi:sugar phosphate permease